MTKKDSAISNGAKDGKAYSVNLSGDYKLEKIEIKNILPTKIDDVILSLVDGELLIKLSDSLDNEKYKNWIATKGGVFKHDIKKYLKGDNSFQYYMLKCTDIKFLIKVFNEEEIANALSKNIIDGLLKDERPFMILRKLSPDESINSIKSDRINFESMDNISLYIDPLDLKSESLSEEFDEEFLNENEEIYEENKIFEENSQ